MKQTVKTELSVRFEEVKRHFRLNNSNLAKMAGCSPQAINDIVNGVTDNPKIGLIRNIVRELGISYDWLVDGVGSMIKGGGADGASPVNDDAVNDFFMQKIQERDRALIERDRQIFEKDKLIARLRGRVGKFRGVFNQANLFPHA